TTTPPPSPYTTLFRSDGARVTIEHPDRACIGGQPVACADLDRFGHLPRPRVDEPDPRGQDVDHPYAVVVGRDRTKAAAEIHRARSEEHTSELQSRVDL